MVKVDERFMTIEIIFRDVVYAANIADMGRHIDLRVHASY